MNMLQQKDGIKYGNLTWMNAIARTRAKTDIDLVSEPTKAQLAMILRRLEEQITQTLEVIEK